MKLMFRNQLPIFESSTAIKLIVCLCFFSISHKFALSQNVSNDNKYRVKFYSVWYYLNESKDTIFEVEMDTLSHKIKILSFFIPCKNEWAKYYPNGQIMEIGKFRKRYHGLSSIFSDVFNLHNYNYREKDGKWEYFDEDGRTLRSVYYDEGHETP